MPTTCISCRQPIFFDTDPGRPGWAHTDTSEYENGSVFCDTSTGATVAAPLAS